MGKALPMEGMRVGLVGAGGISAVHVAAWQELGAQVRVFSQEGSESLAARFGIDIAQDWDSLVGAVDIVDIVTPSSAHRELAVAALRAKKHVVCEKPLASTARDALEILEAADESGMQVYPAQVLRFFPEYARIKNAVDAGSIGRPTVLKFTRAAAAPPATSWFFLEEAGGGIILDLLIHDLDQARWLAGEVTQVYAVQNPPTVGGRVPPTVVAQVVLTHRSGAISFVQGSWGPRGMPFRTSIDVAGSEGALRSDSRSDISVTVDSPSTSGGDSYLPTLSTAESPYTSEMREFATAFNGGAVPRVTGFDGYAAVALAEAANASIRSGRAVDFTLERAAPAAGK